MAPSSTLLVAAAAVLAVASADEYFTGDGTAYTLGDTSAGNCNFMSALSFASTNYAALNNEQWDGLQNCGRCAEVSCADDRCADQTTTEVVQLLDRCPECAHGALDLSPTVFTSLTGSDPARYTIKWKFVDCPLSGNVNYCLKGGSNNFWTAVQPTNVATGVSGLQINGQDTTMIDSAYYYLLDGASQTQTDLTSMTITLTDVNGNSIEDTVSLTAGSCTEGSHQFPSSAGSSPSTQTYTTPTPTTAAPTTSSPTTSSPTTSSPTTSAPTTAPPTSTPTPTTQTPTPTTVSPAPSLTTTTPTQEQESSPSSVPVSTTSTPATTAPSTTAPSTVAPSTTAPVSTTPQSSSSASSDATQGAQDESATFNVTATVAPATTPPSAGEASTANEADVPVATTATPSATAAQTADSQAGDDTQSANTKTEASSSGTDPMIIGMSAFGAVALVALIVVVVVAKRKKIQEQKARDVEAPSMMSVQSFGGHNTPARRQDFAIL
ncbi:hypothetical protein BBJ28_00001027 [Nothophytophthora sp. Chile5]|nr:hypothetical protein BBJ28_00001027 [Nothophytophthora sp. Chile5]